MKEWVTKHLYEILISIVAVFATIQPLVVVVSLLIFSDTITGILAAHKRGEKITSQGFSRTISKLFVYNLAIVLGFLMEKFVLLEVVPVVKAIVLVIGVTEFKSFLENFESITGINLLDKLKQYLHHK